MNKFGEKHLERPSKAFCLFDSFSLLKIEANAQDATGSYNLATEGKGKSREGEGREGNISATFFHAYDDTECLYAVN